MVYLPTHLSVFLGVNAGKLCHALSVWEPKKGAKDRDGWLRCGWQDHSVVQIEAE